MNEYPTISKVDVVESITQLLEGNIRSKIDEWTDQSIIQFLEWFKNNGGTTPHLGLYYVGSDGNRVYCSPRQLLERYKSPHR